MLLHAKITLISCTAAAARAGVKDPEEEDEEELSVLMNRLRSAKPPAEVLKVRLPLVLVSCLWPDQSRPCYCRFWPLH